MPGWKQRLKKQIMLRMLRHSRFFDEKWYRAQAGIPAAEDAAAHYLEGGWKEHDPSPAFRQEGYLAANEDVRREGVCPLAHYLFYGKKQHRPLYPGYAENRYRRLALPRAAARAAWEAACGRMIRRNRGSRLLVIAQIRYPEAAEEMAEYLKNLRKYRYDLAVTVPEGERAETIREKTLRFRPDAEIIPCPGTGTDAAAFAEALRRRAGGKYDIIVRLCSIGTDPRGGRLAEGKHWRGRDRFVMAHRAVLGAGQVHRNIDRLARDPGTALIAAKQMIITDSGRKKRLTARYLREMGLSLEDGYTWVAGGCWMMKAECAEAMKDACRGIKGAGTEGAGTDSPGTEDFGRKGAGAPAEGFTPESALERYLTGWIPAEQKRGIAVCPGRQAMNRIRFREDYRNRAGDTAAQESAAREPAGTGSAAERKPTVAFAVTEAGANAVAGDYFTAMELAEALEKRGWRTKFLPRTEPGDGWYRVGRETDVLVSMLEDYDPQHITEEKEGLVTVGWARNWFDKWAESPGTALYDILMASSAAACREMADRLGREVRLFPIATNPGRFRDGREAEEAAPGFRCDYCFTGNRFGKREIESELDPEKIPYKLNIYGAGWERVRKFAPHCRGHVSYAEMPEAYRGARIVLDDATPSTKETGALNSRVYDATAAGCLVLTNNARGSEETFGGLLPVYTDEASLTEALNRYLGNEALRKEKARELREIVLARHTYGRRAEELEEILREYRAGEEGKA